MSPDWFASWPVAVAALAVLVLPGVLPAYALRLRGAVAWCAAPLLSAAVIGLSAIVGGATGIAWSIWVVIGGSVAAGALAWPLAWSTRRGGPRLLVGPRTVLPGIVIALTTVLAVLAQLRRSLGAVGGPERVAQTYDTPYHLNSVRMILENGDASSLHMTLTVPGRPSAFYPAVWHGATALVAQISGGSVPSAANWVTLVACTVVWPAGMLLLARALFGPRVLFLALAAPAAFALTQFPNRLFSFGLLYPNVYSYALLPAALGLVVVGAFLTHGRGRIPALAGAAVGALGIGLAQPNGTFALLYVSAPVLVLALVRATARSRRRGRPWWKALLPWPVAAAVVACGFGLVMTLPLLSGFVGKANWAVTNTPVGALREAATLTAMHPAITPNFPASENLAGGVPNWPVAVLVVIGGLLALLVRRWRWLPFSYAIVVGLWLLVRGVDVPLRGALTGFWYADPQRIAALLPLVAVPLVVVGLAAPVGALLRVVGSQRSAGVRRTLPVAAAAVLALAIVLVLPRSEHFRSSFAYVAHAYRADPVSVGSDGLLDANESEFMDEVESIVPPGVAIAGDPWDGSALAWAIADRPVIYPHMGIVKDTARALIATSLVDARTDPAVCEAVHELNVGYVLDMGQRLNGEVTVGYPGLLGLEEAGVARVVAEDGPARLLEITAC